MADLVRRIRERKMVQWLIVYVTGAWAITEVIDTLAVSILAVPSFRPVLLLVAALGVPFVLVLAWYHGEKGRQRVSGPEFVIIVILLGVLGGVFMLVGGGKPAVAESTALEPAPAIAVLPSVSGGTEADEIGEGIVSVLSTGLDAVPGWRAVSPRTVYARWTERVPEGSVPDEPTALEIARSTGASYAVLPTTIVLGDSVRVTAEVWDLTRDGARPQSIARSGSPGDLLSLSDGLAVEILGAVLRGSGQIPQIDLSRTTSESPEALRAFLRGEVFYREFRLEDARDAFNLALQHDSTFARADYRLIEVHNWGVTWDTGLMARHRQRALANVDRLTEREALVVRGLSHPDLREQLRLLREAVTKYPDDATAWQFLGERLVHSLGALATEAEADSVFNRAIELDPNRAVLYPHAVGFAFGETGDSARAARLVEAYGEAARGVGGPPTGDFDPRGGPLALAFVFGDSAARSAARTRLSDAMRSAVPPGTGAGPPMDTAALAALGYLRAPPYVDFFWPWMDSLPTVFSPPPLVMLDVVLQMRGKVRSVMETIPVLDDTAARALFDVAIMGIPLPPERLEAEFGSARINAGEARWRLARAGMLAAFEDRPADARQAASILGQIGDTTATDSLDANGMYIGLIDAVAALSRDDAEAALPALEEAIRSGVADVHGTMWLLADAYMRLGRWSDAERVLRTVAAPVPRSPFSWYPLVRYRLGQVLEAQGRPQEAAAAFAYFAQHWQAADSELQPLVRDALDRIGRLSPDRARAPD